MTKHPFRMSWSVQVTHYLLDLSLFVLFLQIFYSLTVFIYADGNAAKNVSMNENSGWFGSFSNALSYANPLSYVGTSTPELATAIDTEANLFSSILDGVKNYGGIFLGYLSHFVFDLISRFKAIFTFFLEAIKHPMNRVYFCIIVVLMNFSAFIIPPIYYIWRVYLRKYFRKVINYVEQSEYYKNISTWLGFHHERFISSYLEKKFYPRMKKKISATSSAKEKAKSEKIDYRIIITG